MSSFISQSVRLFRGCDSLSGSYHLRCLQWSHIPFSFVDTVTQQTTGNNDNVLLDERRLGGIRGAKKKAGGSSTNGRNSAGRRLGIKVWPNKFAKAGNIIVRQRGNLFRAGTNVGVGKDHTLFAKADGMVSLTRLETNKKRNVVHVLPPSTQMHYNILAKLGIDPESLKATQ